MQSTSIYQRVETMELGYNNKPDNDRHYIAFMRPLFNKEAVFSDTTGNFVTPEEPNAYEEVEITIRIAKDNADAIVLMTGGQEHPMELKKSEGLFDFYSCRVSLSDTEFNYYFKIAYGIYWFIYDQSGLRLGTDNLLQFSIFPGFHTPNWAKGAVMYQIYTDRFCNGDPTNDVEDREYYYIGGHSRAIKDWDKEPDPDGAQSTRDFYGGDLQGVINKLDYLSSLGIDAIYFNPLFVSPSNHKYDSQDYEHIDPHFGKIVEDGGECLAEGDTDNKNASKYKSRVCSLKNLEASDELFCELVRLAHERGMRVILDGVFNHCGSFNKWLDRERIYEGSEDFEKGAFVSKESPYVDYFDFKNPDGWPYNTSYDGWWGHDTLPKLNYEASPSLYDKIIEIAKKWVTPPFNADGWRLDVAADLGHSPEFNHAFFKRFRKAVKEVNPDAIILAEHYGDPKSWLNGTEWDSVMNYDAFMEPVTWFLTGMEKHSDDFKWDLLGNSDVFFNSMTYAGSRLSNCAKLVSMNELSNHDHSRFLTRTNGKIGRTNTLGCAQADRDVDKSVMRLAVLMQMTWVGAPTIYYGDEAGQTGFTDPDSRRTYPWGREDDKLINFHKEMIRIHKENPVLTYGSTKALIRERHLLSYARFDSETAMIVLVNRDDVDRNVNVPAWEVSPAGAVRYTTLMYTDRDDFDTAEKEITGENGFLSLTLPAKAGMAIRINKI